MNEPDFKDEANNLIRNFGFDEAFLTGAIHAALRQMYSAGVQAGREEAALISVIHSQYPITTEFDRGYAKARKDAARAIRTRWKDDICPANGRREGEE